MIANGYMSRPNRTDSTTVRICRCSELTGSRLCPDCQITICATGSNWESGKQLTKFSEIKRGGTQLDRVHRGQQHLIDQTARENARAVRILSRKSERSQRPPERFERHRRIKRSSAKG